MLSRSANWDDAWAGSVQVKTQVDAWYDGQLIGENLPVVSGQAAGDSSALIQTTGSVAVASGDDMLIPAAYGSILGCWGTVLHVRQGLQLPGGGVELLDLGWLRIKSGSSSEAWQTYGSGVPLRVAARGSAATVPVEDLMAIIDEDVFGAPEQPASLTSTLAEIQRLAQHSGSVIADWSDVTDAPISKAIVYSDSRSAAIQTLAGSLGRTARMDRTGALDLVPTVPTAAALAAPVWHVGFADVKGPSLTDIARSWDREGTYNAVKSTSTDAAGNALVGWATVTNGPLRFGGPFGRRVYGRSAPLAVTQAAVNNDATTALSTLLQQATIKVPLTVPANVAVELLDVISVDLPAAAGSNDVVTVTGWVNTMSVPLGSATMQVELAVPRSSVWGWQ